jgi:hypothetical protein
MRKEVLNTPLSFIIVHKHNSNEKKFWCCTSVISALGRLKQEGLSLGYRLREKKMI